MTPLVRLLDRLYGAVLRLYPPDFRDGWGPELHGAFRTGLERRSGGLEEGGVLWFGAGELADLARGLPAEWLVHQSGWWRGLGHDLRFAFRRLRKRPAFTFVAGGTLALGIGANAAVFGVVDGVLLEPLPYPDADELVYMYESDRNGEARSVSYLNYLDWRTRNRVFSRVGARSGWSFTLTGRGEARPVDARLISANLPALLGVEPVIGRTFTPEEAAREERVLVLSGEAWERVFGADPSIVGGTLTLDDEPFEVVGVFPPGLEFPLDGVDVFAPLTVLSANDRSSRGSHPGITVIARLRDGSDLEAARSDMDAVASALEREYPDTNEGADVVVRSLRERYLGDSRAILILFGGAVALVLLIACANVANLLLARGRARQREAALRTALGAGRYRVARLFLVQSLVLVALAGLTGSVLAVWGTAVLRALAPEGLARVQRASVDGTVLFFTLGVSGVVVLLVGVLPALRLSTVDPVRGLGAGGTRGASGRGGPLRSALVVAEVALSFVLLVGAGLMVRSMSHLLERDLGLDPESVVTLRVPVSASRYPVVEDRHRFYSNLVERVESLPGVVSAGGVDPLPLSGFNRQSQLSGEGLETVGPDGLRTDVYAVTAGYFETMGVPLVSGRTFTGDETPDDPVVVIDEFLADRLWPGESALGRRMRFSGSGSPWLTVVGVVGHVAHYGVNAEGRVQLYLPSAVRVRSQSLVVRTSAEDPGAVVPAIRRAVSELDPAVPVDRVRTMESLFRETIGSETLTTRILTAFGGVALLLALLGLYGVISYTVSLRRREIGIRMALGARASTVIKRITADGLVLAGGGVVLGLGGALLTTRLLSEFLYGVAPSDPMTLSTVGLGLFVVAGIATLLPALRATRIDPATTLRAE